MRFLGCCSVFDIHSSCLFVTAELVEESRSLGFGDRPMLTLEGVHAHNQEMERVSALMDREHQLTKEHEERGRRSESPATGQIESLQAKLQALEKFSTEHGEGILLGTSKGREFCQQT